MGWLTIIVACGAFLLALVLHSVVLIAAVGVLLMIYLWALMHDARLSNADLNKVASSLTKIRRDGDPHALGTWKPITSLGQTFGQLLEQLYYRVQSVLWEAQAQEPSAVPLGQVLTTPVTAGVEDEELDTKLFFERMLGELARAFRAKSAAIIYEHSWKANNDLQQDHHIVLQRVSGKRFESALQHLFVPFFSWGLRESFGLRDNALPESALGDLSIFGFRFSLSAPFEAISESGSLRGVLWLGYSSEVPPAEFELRTLEQTVQELGVETAKLLKLSDFSLRARDAEQSNKDNAQAIAQISHDIRSPLNNVKAVINLLMLETAKSDSSDMLEVALKNCDSLSEIVSDLLDYSRHQMGKLTAEPEDFSLVKVVRDVVDSYSVTARLKGLTLQTQIEEGNLEIRGDKTQIKRVVSNLVSNAIKYTNKGGVYVSVSLTENSFVKLAVRDTGIGMTLEQLTQLFTPFTRFHKDQAEGIGLGLALSRVLIELNRGTMAVRSEQGKGSEFEVAIPLLKKMEIVPEPVRPEPVQFDGRSRAVLVVDDDASCVDALARALQRIGCVVSKAYSVAEAVAAARATKLDAIISDASMPGGGIKALIIGLRAVNCSVPFAVLSGEISRAAEFKELGASLVLEKPSDISEVQQWVKRQPCA